MSQKLISRSQDLQRLKEEGYDIEVRRGFLLVKSVPYVNSRREVALGTLVSDLTLAGDVTAAPRDHTVWFAGEYPCAEDGTPIEAIRNSSGSQELDQGLKVDHRFSSRPTIPDQDFYGKMIRYVAILLGPAVAIEPDSSARLNRFVESTDENSPFVYSDTASSNSGTVAVSRKLEIGPVAIIGLGGTGAYVLDLVAKTPVSQIHLFDADVFLQHNAFRSPGAASCEELQSIPLKVDYFAQLYGEMHRGIVPHSYYVDDTNCDELRDMAFVFLCLDRGHAKRPIIASLLDGKLPFVDACMGVEAIDGFLGGILTVTTATPDKHDHLATRVAYSDADPNADYSRSIQIADLNALNAALAVIRWKKLFGFYRDLSKEHYSTFTIDCNLLTSDDTT